MKSPKQMTTQAIKSEIFKITLAKQADTLWHWKNLIRYSDLKDELRNRENEGTKDNDIS